MIYINRTVKGYYVELSSALDEKSNLIGTTWEDFKNEYWILLSGEQIAFKNDNPEEDILFRWRGHASMLFSNWLNYYVYQETPFDINQIK